jgi:hypothetical protein
MSYMRINLPGLGEEKEVKHLMANFKFIASSYLRSNLLNESNTNKQFNVCNQICC